MKTSKYYDALWKIGKLSGCHQMAERSFYIFGKQFPICARCTGAFIGYIFGGFLFHTIKLPIAIDFMFCFVMFCDWIIQKLKIVNSNNIRRLITGGLCGFALIQLYGMVICYCISVFV